MQRAEIQQLQRREPASIPAAEINELNKDQVVLRRSKQLGRKHGGEDLLKKILFMHLDSFLSCRTSHSRMKKMTQFGTKAKKTFWIVRSIGF